MVNKAGVVLMFVLILFGISAVSAVGVDNPSLPIVKPAAEEFDNNTAFVNASNFWITDEGVLNNVADIEHNWLSNLAWSVTGHIMDTTLEMLGFNIDVGGGSIVDAEDINSTGYTIITSNQVGADDSQHNIISTNQLGYAGYRLVNSDEDELFVSMFSRAIAQAIPVFAQFLEENDTLMGLGAKGGPLAFFTLDNKKLLFGGSPDGNFSKTDLFFSLDPRLKKAELDGNKGFRPVTIDGIEALIFESTEGAGEGEVTFAFFATDTNNNSVAQRAFQIGKNHSASPEMNSQIVAPKDFLTMPADVKAEFDNNTGDPIIEEWINNITNCFVYEEYLQGLPFGFLLRGLQTACDTTGQGVPTSILGYVEAVGRIYGHGGATIFSDMDILLDDGESVDIIGGDMRIRKEQIVTGNFTQDNQTICDFDGLTLCNFVSESIAPEVGRDWDAVTEDECHSNSCANAKGENLKVMCEDRDWSNRENINITFWLTTATGAPLDTLTISLDNNIGDTIDIFTETTTVIDEFNSFVFPVAYEDEPNVTMCVEWDGANVVREAWIDEIIYTSDLIVPTIINQSLLQAHQTYGEDSGSSDECFVEQIYEVNETTFEVQKVMQFGCPTGITRILGEVEQADVTQVFINVTNNITANNFIAREAIYAGNGFTGDCVNTSFVSGIAVGCND